MTTKRITHKNLPEGKTQSTLRAEKEKKEKGLVMIFTGKGKGKTTAACGMMLRAYGQGLRVACVQFMKSGSESWGLTKLAARLKIDWTTTGDGFTWDSKDLDASAARAVEAWERVKEKISSDRFDMIVLDEFTYPMHYGWLETAEVVAWLTANKPPMLHLAITGRYAPEALCQFADMVSTIKPGKHHIKQGISAQIGVEY